MAVEFELKFRASTDALCAIADALTEPCVTYRMETTYYDTPDRSLSGRHITLRKRQENETSVCALKAPAKLGRLEFEVEKEAIEEAIPELCKLSGMPELPALLAGGVAPVCGARFTRKAYTLTFMDSVLELALDEGALLGGGKELPLCEVEVELKQGDPKAASAYATRLALAYGLDTETQSKFKRAFRLAQEAQHGI